MTETEIMDFAHAEFEWLHAHPELAYEELETTARLRADFARAGIRMRDLPLATGLEREQILALLCGRIWMLCP